MLSQFWEKMFHVHSFVAQNDLLLKEWQRLCSDVQEIHIWKVPLSP